MIGMMRRTPVPISPAEVTSPMRAVMVKTYLVCRTGVIELVHPGHHALRQPGRQQRKRNQNDQPDEVRRHERNHAAEDRGERYVLYDTLDDKYVHADRRMDQAKLHRHHD